MSRFQAEPGFLLCRYVHSYWGLARDLSKTGGFTVTPDRFLELIFFLDPPAVEHASEQRQLPACVLIPLLNQPLRLVTSGIIRCAAVRLHAWAAGCVLPPAESPPQQWHDASAAFADTLPPVRAALRRGAWQEITGLFDAALPRVLSAWQPTAPALAAARAFVASPDANEAQGTHDAAARQGCSRRQIERQVRTLTGQSPKQLSSLARFQFVRDTLWARPGVELATLAFEAGYADQAHLTRHFRRYAAQTPGEFIREAIRLKAWLRAQDVAFVQDE